MLRFGYEKVWTTSYILNTQHTTYQNYHYTIIRGVTILCIGYEKMWTTS